MPSCHSPRPGHYRTATWATAASQDQSRCNVTTPLWLCMFPRGGNPDSEILGACPVSPGSLVMRGAPVPAAGFQQVREIPAVLDTHSGRYLPEATQQVVKGHGGRHPSVSPKLGGFPAPTVQ